MPYKDCRDCIYCLYSRGTYLCVAEVTPKPTSWMRDPRNDCGLEARLFEPKPLKMGEKPNAAV